MHDCIKCVLFEFYENDTIMNVRCTVIVSDSNQLTSKGIQFNVHLTAIGRYIRLPFQLQFSICNYTFLVSSFFEPDLKATDLMAIDSHL